MAALSNYAENKIIDQLFRGQAFTFPTTLYVGLYTAAPSETGGGTEVSGGSYARVAVTANMTNWAGTQAAGSTTASSGTSGTTSNNIAVTFPAPTASWGVITSVGIFDAATAGNMLIYGNLTISKTVNNGDSAPTFQASALAFQIDN
jgi:hypothetical protein